MNDEHKATSYDYVLSDSPEREELCRGITTARFSMFGRRVPYSLPDSLTYTYSSQTVRFSTRFFPRPTGIGFVIGNSIFNITTIFENPTDGEISHLSEVHRFLHERNEEQGVEYPLEFQYIELENQLELLTEQVEEAQREKERLEFETEGIKARLEKAQKQIIAVDNQRIGERQAKRVIQAAFDELQGKSGQVSIEKPRSHYTINEIAALHDLVPNTISTYVNEMRKADEKLSKKLQRIKTERYKPLTVEGYDHLKEFMATKKERPGRRKPN